MINRDTLQRTIEALRCEEQRLCDEAYRINAPSEKDRLNALGGRCLTAIDALLAIMKARSYS